MIVNKTLWLCLVMFFYSKATTCYANPINLIELSELKHNRLILNQENEFEFPIESIIISKKEVLIKTYGAEYAPAKLEMDKNNTYKIKNLTFLYLSENITYTNSIDKNKIEIYKNGNFRIKLFFNSKKERQIDYAIVYGKSNFRNKEYHFEGKFIPSNKLK